MLSFFRAKQLGIPAARWGVAVGSIGFFLLYEELPQLILQSQYGVFPGYKDVLVSFGLMTQKYANRLDKMVPNAGQPRSAAGRAGVSERDMREIADQVTEQLRRDLDAAAARRGGR